jgi:hypothetical protein
MTMKKLIAPIVANELEFGRVTSAAQNGLVL